MNVHPMKWKLIAHVIAVICLASASATAAGLSTSPRADFPSECAQLQQSQKTARKAGPMSVAQLGRSEDGERIARGDECPVGSGAYCSDESPYCFMCKGEYACCWSSQVWRCCN